MSFEKLALQSLKDSHRYLDNSLAVFHGPRLLAKYDALRVFKK